MRFSQCSHRTAGRACRKNSIEFGLAKRGPSNSAIAFLSISPPEDVKENPEFRPNEWNPTKSWNIPKNVDLMFSIQENESGKEIARLRGHFDGENFRRPSGEPMYAFCRGFHATKYKSLIKCWPDDQKSEWISGDFLARVAEFDRRLVEEMEGYEKCLSR